MYIKPVVLDEECDLVAEKSLKIVTYQEYREKGLEIVLGPLVKEGAHLVRGDLLLTFEGPNISIPINAPVDMEIEKIFNDDHYRETNERLLVKPDILITEENIDDIQKTFFNEGLNAIHEESYNRWHALHLKIRENVQRQTAIHNELGQLAEKEAGLLEEETKLIALESESTKLHEEFMRRHRLYDVMDRIAWAAVGLALIVLLFVLLDLLGRAASLFSMILSAVCMAYFFLQPIMSKNIDNKENEEIKKVDNKLKRLSKKLKQNRPQVEGDSEDIRKQLRNELKRLKEEEKKLDEEINEMA